jgi:hypothetical protein
VDDPEMAAAAAAAAMRFKSECESIGCRSPGPVMSGNPIPPAAVILLLELPFEDIEDDSRGGGGLTLPQYELRLVLVSVWPDAVVDEPEVSIQRL